MIEIAHNLEPRDFVWLWAKYVTGFNPEHHCTNSICGLYSRKLTKHNKELTTSEIIIMDECPQDSYRALYICGVARQGYARKTNYQHNLHAAISPRRGAVETWLLEKWRLQIRGGVFLHIPTSVQELPPRYWDLPPKYTTCRIFRWSACYFDASNQSLAVESKLDSDPPCASET
jgi:hypothetical protein